MDRLITFIKIICFIGLVLTSSLSFSDIIKLGGVNIGSTTGTGGHPNLNFEGATRFNLTIGNSETWERSTINRLDIAFPNANKLVARNLQSAGDNRFVTIVHGAWLYKSVLVTLILHEGARVGGSFDLLVTALDTETNLGPLSYDISNYMDYHLFTVTGRLIDARQKVLADKTIIKYNEKD